MKTEVKNLIERASKANTPEDAMKFAQAALNAANAARVVLDYEITRNQSGGTDPFPT
jgi:hypothetical protein